MSKFSFVLVLIIVMVASGVSGFTLCLILQRPDGSAGLNGALDISPSAERDLPEVIITQLPDGSVDIQGHPKVKVTFRTTTTPATMPVLEKPLRFNNSAEEAELPAEAEIMKPAEAELPK